MTLSLTVSIGMTHWAWLVLCLGFPHAAQVYGECCPQKRKTRLLLHVLVEVGPQDGGCLLQVEDSLDEMLGTRVPPIVGVFSLEYLHIHKELSLGWDSV